MFGSIGTFVYRMRYAVIAVLIALMGGLGLYGMDLPKYLSQSGWFDPNSESVQGSIIADESLGRDHKADVILLITAPEGVELGGDSAESREFRASVEELLDTLVAEHGDVVSRTMPSIDDPDGPAGMIDPFTESSGTALDDEVIKQKREAMFTVDENGREHGFVSIGIRGYDDTSILANYKTVEPFFDDIGSHFNGPEGTQFQVAGLQPVAGAMARGMEDDIVRAEIIALPVVALMLLFVFGSVTAAILPVLIGGLTIAGSLGIMKILAQLTELNVFAQSVVTLIGLGIAIDYGLFMVSRFREELAEGYTVKAAVRRAVMTSGQTIVFSATIIVAALACLLIFPQAFLKSVAYGAIASVALAALLSITVLPAILAILGRRIDWLSVPFLNKTKTREEVENGFWGKLAGWVMKHPLKTAVPTILLLLALIIPFGSIAFGGISEKYLPPDNPNRLAQEHFDQLFPQHRTEGIRLVIVYDPNSSGDSEALQQFVDEVNQVPGLTNTISLASDGPFPAEGSTYYADDRLYVNVFQAGLQNRNDAAGVISDIRGIDSGPLYVYVAGTPALTQDSIDSLMKRLPLMAVILVLVTGLLMFLAFGSVVLPIKAALVSVLGLGSTLGILTWIFIDGHGAEILNFTPAPLFAAVLVLIIAIIYGLSTDYEIFLLARMVEARQQGASTTEAIRTGTANTGRLITAAAAILVVVTGAFALSDIVMMKYIAYGMIAALILDATIIRMLVVPSVMKLLGDDCWWSPRWMRALQRKIGLGEKVLLDEPDQKVGFGSGLVLVGPNASSGEVIEAAEAPTTAMVAVTTTGTETGDTTVEARPLAGQAEPTGLWRKLSRKSTQDTAAIAAEAGPTAEATLDELVGDDAAATTAVPKPVTATAPVAATAPAPESARKRRRGDGPDTGSWRLGKSGVRQATTDLRPRPEPAPPAPPQAPQPPQPQAPQPQAPQRPASGQQPQRPASGRQPLRPGPATASQYRGPGESGPVPRPAPPAPGTGRPPLPVPPPMPAAPPRVPQAPQQPQASPSPQVAPPRQVPPPPQPRWVPPAPAGRTSDSGTNSGSGNGDDASPLDRRPDLDQTGKRPLAAALDPDFDIAAYRESRPAESGPSRELRRDRGASGNQISVQELLRRRRQLEEDPDGDA